MYVRFNVPETKNRTVLEINAEFEKMHRKPGASEEKQYTDHEEATAQETKLWSDVFTIAYTWTDVRLTDQTEK